MKHNIRSRILGTICIICTIHLLTFTNIVSANLITNGDFESGNTGFSSGYTFYDNPTSLPIGYTLTVNPISHHVNTRDFGDHTSGSGLMMMVNGSVFGTVVWSQDITVQANSLYDFSVFIKAWQPHGGTDVNLQLQMDGISIGPSFNPSFTAVNDWLEFSREFNSNAGGSINLSLVDLENALAGRDFVLDDLSLSNVPTPAAVWLFGSGLLGLIGVTRRKKA